MKVTSKTNFGYIDDASVVKSIDADALVEFGKKHCSALKYKRSSDCIAYVQQNYAEVILFAQQLKGQHDGKHTGQSYSDLFYLEYALVYSNTQELGRLNSLSKPPLGINALDDPEWSQYSPEEIVQMSDDGFVVPEEVISWARSMREADVTSYIVLSDEGGVDGTADSGVDTDINALRKQATDYILKVNRAQEDISENSKIIERKQKEIKRIEKQNRMFKKYSIEKIKKDADELKKLEEKADSGQKLDIFEKAKLKKLRKQLGEDSSRIKNLQATQDKMDDFLASIDALQDEANADIKLADDTVAAAEELAKLKNDYDSDLLTSANPELLYNQNSGISDLVAGALTAKIPDVADRVATELRDTSQEVIVSIDSDKSQGYIEFAKNYSQGANQVQEALGLNDDNSSDAPEGEEQIEDKNPRQVNNEFSEFMTKAFWVAAPFSANPVVAYIMTMATLLSMTNTSTVRKQLARSNEELQKGLKQYAKESKKLEQETSKVEAQKAENELKLAEYTSKLAELEDRSGAIAQEAEVSVEQAAAEDGETENTEIQSQLDDKIAENDEVSSEKDAISAQIDALKLNSQNATKGLSTSIAKTNKILSDNKNISKAIKSDSQQLEKLGNTTKILSAQSTLGGHITAPTGAYNLSVGIPLLSKAMVMMASVYPPTAMMGAMLAEVAYNLIGLGTMQVLYGTGEIAAGVAGFDEAGKANIQLNAVQGPEKDHEQNTKMSRALFKQSSETLNSFAASMGIDLGRENGQNPLNLPSANDNNKNDSDNDTKQNNTMADKKVNSENKPNLEQNKNKLAENVVQPSEKKINEPQNAYADNEGGKSKSTEVPKAKVLKNIEISDEDSESDLKLKELRNKNEESKEEFELDEKTDNEIEKEVLRELEIEDHETDLQIQKEKQEEEQKVQQNNDTLIAAAASTGVNLYSALDTTDKAEKKLTRFNNDSIIESRKKAKKVMAISAAQKKRA